MKAVKPLGHRSYGSIGHLPGSRKTPGDKTIHPGQARICTEKARDRHDLIIVQEKLDGTNVSVAKIEGQIVPLIRAGYAAVDSHHLQHRMFAEWAFERWDRFDALLDEGERACGEWLAQAHGTKYRLVTEQVAREPFALFDIMRVHDRVLYDDMIGREASAWFHLPTLLHAGGPCTIEQANRFLGKHGHHGATDPAEGCVWRVERRGKVDFLAKYVRPDKVDGCYLPGTDNTLVTEPVWNWPPSGGTA